MKNFNGWNEVKKITHNNNAPIGSFPKEREIWWSSVGVNIGVETDGKHETFERPVLIIRVFNQEMLWVVPVTSTMSVEDFERVTEALVCLVKAKSLRKGGISRRPKP